MRAFLAIEIANGVASKLAKLQLELQRAIGSSPVRWVSEDAIHITLKFLGEISVEQASRLSHELGFLAGSVEPFTLAAAGLGCFPHCGRPRIVWIGVDDDLRALESLQNAVECWAVRLGYIPERHRFSAHITVGRVRTGLRSVEIASLREAFTSANKLRFGHWRVTEVVLMQSEFMPGGVQYSCWARIPFQHKS